MGKTEMESTNGTPTTRRRVSSTAETEPLPVESTEQGFRKLFASVADPQTRENHQRHLALTKNVLYQNELGWKLAELPLVAELLMVLREKILDGAPQFTELLLQAVRLCSKPFIRLKSNEELSNTSLLTDFVPTLAQLLSFEVVEIQVASAEALRQFAIGACLTRPSKSKNQVLDTSNAEDLRLPTRVLSQNVMEETGAVDMIVGVLHDLFPDDEEDEEPRQHEPPAVSDDSPRPLTPSTKSEEETPSQTRGDSSERTQQRETRLAALLFPMMDLVYELSSHQRCAEVLVVTGALHYVVYVLSGISSPQDELLPLCLTTLWNVLELSEEKMKTITKCASRRELLVQFRLRNATFFLSTEFTLQTLLKTLELLLLKGYRRQDKELRNECLMVLLLLARRQRSLDLFFSTGLTACLLSYATSCELARKTKTPASGTQAAAIVADPHHYATNSDDDLEFKQTLWLLVSVIATGHADNLQSIVQFRFLDVLLEYATDTTGAGGRSSLSTHDQKSASKAATSATAVQKYSVPQLQILQSVALAVLTNIAPYLLDHWYDIQGHVRLLDFLQLAIGSETVLTTAWQLFLHLAPPLSHIQDELGRLRAVETALTAFSTPPSRHTYAIRRSAIITCAYLCRNHELNRSRFYESNGVRAVVSHLVLDVAHAVLEDNLLVGVVEAVRSCIVGQAESELAFIRLDGVPKLLDVLERAPKAVKHQVLAALAEITVNPAAIPSYAGWRSDLKETNNATASQVLLRLYAEEEAVEEKHTMTQYENQPDHAAQDQHTLVAATSLRSSAFRSIATCKTPLVVFPPNAAEELTVSPTSPTERPSSPAFARLKEALKAGQTPAKKSLLELGASDFHPQINLKAKIHAVLENLSFACDPSERLSPKELVVLEIAKEYPTFRMGEMWQNVQLTLHAEGTRPIYADALYIRKQIEHAYNIAVCTKHAQKEITTRDHATSTSREEAFFQSILKQKQQDEQAEAFLIANKRQNSTMKLHLDAKRTRLEFMKRQDPTAFAAYEKEQRRKIDDPPPIHDEELSSLAQKEKELRGRLSTIQIAPSKPY